ncbi:hypothetical protein PCE1_002944 [Barthelona sp. PCE]
MENGNLNINHASVKSYIEENCTFYDGDASFLAGATERTVALWDKIKDLLVEEIKNGVLDVDTSTVSDIDAFQAGYIEKDIETIVGLQADAPLKRTLKPYGGLRVVQAAAKAYGYTLDAKVEEIFDKYVITHNDGCFAMYDPEIRACRTTGILTGLPDAYSRGRIIGDTRRVALYGVDALIAQKQWDKHNLMPISMDEADMRLSKEIMFQIKALKQLKNMAASYGFDISRPAETAAEAIQWSYFGYLAAIKQSDGAAMSYGRVSRFFDIYIEKDMKEGRLTEEQAQELIDHWVMKLRLVRHLRTPAYNELFAGDPTWVTLVLGGCLENGDNGVCKTDFRILQSFYNMGPAPEPNITICWNTEGRMSEHFKTFCAKVSVETSCIQYENDQLMQEAGYGCDYGIACCVSAMKMGEQMQFFGARFNAVKLLLFAFNGGKDEIKNKQVGPVYPVLETTDYDVVMERYMLYLDWLAEVYVRTMNMIHYSHDTYFYESLQLGLHDTFVHRFMAFGAAGVSTVADAFSAMKYAKVSIERDPETGLTTGFPIEGDYPKFGNDDDRVDSIYCFIVDEITRKLRRHKTYRDAEHSLSLLTITSNVVYGTKTGACPGRGAGVPFAPGASPVHGAPVNGAFAELNSLAKISYDSCRDGISHTAGFSTSSLGKTTEERIENLKILLEGFFSKRVHNGKRQMGFHVNVNVFDREILEDAMAHPEKYPALTIRVSGYAILFIRLDEAKQREVIARTIHSQM